MRSFKRELHIKNLYIKAAQTVMDQNLKTAKQYINRTMVVDYLKHILKHSGKDEVILADCHGAFFDLLCRRIVTAKYSDDVAVCVMHPCYSGNMICQMYIPRTESVFINRFFEENDCKVNQLYTVDLSSKTAHNTLIAQKMCRYSKKQQ